MIDGSDSGGVYLIENTLNKKRYVGSSTKPTRRWADHLLTLRKNAHCNAHLQSAFNKYGAGVFVFRIIEITDKLTTREQYYIDTLQPEYNICKTAGRTTGYKHTETTKRLMSGTNHWLYGRRMPEEIKKKIGDSLTGQKRSPEVCAKHRGSNNAFFGKTHTEDARRRMSVSKKIPVERVDSAGIVTWYASARDTAADGFLPSHVTACCKKHKKHHRGFSWRYADLVLS